MPRRRREDFPGAWFHVTNRGIAKRTMFERRHDVRYFLSRVARMVHVGLIELHSYSLLTTHFHLLLRSCTGELSRAMQRIQGEYSRSFNRKRRRDGSLVRARYVAKLVDSVVYRDNVIRYIDANAVDAGFVALPQSFPCGSASCYGGDRRSPPWLERGWIEKRVCERAGCSEFSPEAYRRVYRPKLSPDREAWILRRLASKDGFVDPLDDLIDAAPWRVRVWMQRKAKLADATAIGMPLLPAGLVDDAALARAEELRVLQADLRRLRGGRPDLLLIARAGLLFDIASLTIREVAARLDFAEATVYGYRRQHRHLLQSHAGYARVVADAVHSALHELR
ncbi:MAG: transposase [Planctomycetota bacterium]